MQNPHMDSHEIKFCVQSIVSAEMFVLNFKFIAHIHNNWSTLFLQTQRRFVATWKREVKKETEFATINLTIFSNCVVFARKEKEEGEEKKITQKIERKECMKFKPTCNLNKRVCLACHLFQYRWHESEQIESNALANSLFVNLRSVRSTQNDSEEPQAGGWCSLWSI